MKGENAFIIKGIRRQRHQNDMFLSPSSHMIIYWWKAKRVIVNKNNLSCESSFLHSDFQLQRKKSTEMSGAFLGDYIITTLRRETFLSRTASRGVSKLIELFPWACMYLVTVNYQIDYQQRHNYPGSSVFLELF